jgi:hypothetical protein
MITESTDMQDVLALPDISGEQVELLGRQIDATGFAVIPGYISGNTLSALRTMVSSIVAKAGGQYAVLTGRDDVAGTVLDVIGADPRFKGLMHRIYEAGRKKPAPTQSLYQVLRCISGETGHGQAYFFHYDSYVVTALLPIMIPSEGQRGDLIMRPNNRSVRSAYLFNLFDKILVDNSFAQKIFRKRALENKAGFKKVQIEPGNLYLFWGYRTLHANEACDPQQIRATALFHFGDPHMGSGLRKLTGRAQVRATAPLVDVPATA